MQNFMIRKKFHEKINPGRLSKRDSLRGHFSKVSLLEFLCNWRAVSVAQTTVLIDLVKFVSNLFFI